MKPIAASGWCLLLFVCAFPLYTFGQEAAGLPVGDVDRQPLEASIERLVQALELAGSPLPSETLSRLEELKQDTRDATVVGALQSLLDPMCLVAVQINPESRVKVLRGAGPARLQEQGWTNVLVKVVNEAGVTAPLSCVSPQAQPIFRRSSNKPNPKIDISPADAAQRWLDIAMVTSQPMTPTLSGLGVEYRIVQLYSRDSGSREATLSFNVGQGTQDLGFRSDVPILFECTPSVDVRLVIHDENGQPTTCSLLIRDDKGRIHPNPSRRLAPDFSFTTKFIELTERRFA